MRMSGYTETAIRNGQHPRGVARFFSVLLLLACTPLAVAQETALRDIAQLAKDGAPQLALSLLQQEQPEYAKDEGQWMRWERMRVRIMEQRGQWAELEQHLASLPAELPKDFLSWATSRRARALVFADRPAEARQLLRDLIWLSDGTGSEDLAQWRQLVVQSYLRQGRIDDAYVAMLRYHQDYGDGSNEAALMRVRVLLASQRPVEAASQLQSMPKDRTTDLLRLLAKLRTSGQAAAILKRLRGEKTLADYTPLERYLHYGVMAEAAIAAGEPAFAIIALERWFRMPSPVEEWSELFTLTPDMLWDNYLAYAQRQGNSKQLLIGDDEAWWKLAEKTDKRYPVGKRSLYALLTREAFSLEIREKAAVRLVDLLQTMENGIAVAQRLFLDSQHYNTRTPIPPAVAYLLVDQAIRDGDLQLASRLMRQLPEPPGDVAKFPWQLRRVKVFILAGENSAAVELLRKLMPAVPSLGKAQRDQLMQLLFDLQTVGEYEAAYALLEEMYKSNSNLELRRELLYWMADSRLAQKNYVEAAQLYLSSATLSDNNSMDPWAQTARYKAAETLTKGGMLADAAHIYSQLLQVTEQPERRAVLRHELEQLRMRQAADVKK